MYNGILLDNRPEASKATLHELVKRLALQLPGRQVSLRRVPVKESSKYRSSTSEHLKEVSPSKMQAVKGFVLPFQLIDDVICKFLLS